jgi:hypothetical protein
MSNPTKPTRKQLAEFLRDHKSIRLFERLFEVAGKLTPEDVDTLFRLVDEVDIKTGIADSKAQGALDYANRLEDGKLKEANIGAETAGAKAQQALDMAVNNGIKSKSNGVLTWLSM